MGNRSPSPRDLVPHPRYGAESVGSGCDVPLEVIRSVHVHDRLPVFPRSAIPADVSRQSYSIRPRRCYVDILKGCRACGRDFLFFAREQQYWYEVLGFWIDADCVHCPECRRANHRRRRAFQRFSGLVNKRDLSDEELVLLAEDATFLHEAGVLRCEQKLRRIKNLVLSRLPQHQATGAIVDLIEKFQALG